MNRILVRGMATAFFIWGLVAISNAVVERQRENRTPKKEHSPIDIEFVLEGEARALDVPLGERRRLEMKTTRVLRNDEEIHYFINDEAVVDLIYEGPGRNGVLADLAKPVLRGVKVGQTNVCVSVAAKGLPLKLATDCMNVAVPPPRR